MAGDRCIVFFSTSIFGLLVMVLLNTDRTQSTMTASNRNIEDEIATIELYESLLENYDMESRPYFGAETPVAVTVDIYLASLDSISEMNMDFSITIYMRQRWYDPRLAYNSSVILPPTSDLVDKIWLPDLIVGNAKVAKIHNLTRTNKWVQIQPSGHVLYTVRMSLLLSCPMDFHHFPMDHQACEMELESFQNTIDEVYYKWNEEEPTEYNKNLLRLPQYEFEGVHIMKGCTKRLKTGSYSCLTMDFIFHRLIGYYMLQAYLPSILLLGTSWVSFWLPILSVPARVVLGMMTALSTITLYNGVRNDISHVSYVKAIDVWFGVCLVFAIGTLVEYALVHYLSFNRLGIPVKSSKISQKAEHCFVMTLATNQEENGSPSTKGIKKISGNRATKNVQLINQISPDEKGYDDEKMADVGGYTNQVDCLEGESEEDPAKYANDRHHQGYDTDPSMNIDFPKILCVKGNCDTEGKGQEILYDTGIKIDYFCRLLFPVAFAVFNIVYWSYYLREGKEPTHSFHDDE